MSEQDLKQEEELPILYAVKRGRRTVAITIATSLHKAALNIPSATVGDWSIQAVGTAQNGVYFNLENMDLLHHITTPLQEYTYDEERK